MSTYWRLGCPRCKEYCDAASQQGSGAYPLGDDILTLRHFIAYHSPCKHLQVIGEWDERIRCWRAWTGQNVEALYDRDRDSGRGDCETESLGYEGSSPEESARVEAAIEIHREVLDAAERLCRIYFDIAASVLGEAEVRRRRDAVLDGAEAPAPLVSVYALVSALRRLTNAVADEGFFPGGEKEQARADAMAILKEIDRAHP